MHVPNINIIVFLISLYAADDFKINFAKNVNLNSLHMKGYCLNRVEHILITWGIARYERFSFVRMVSLNLHLLKRRQKSPVCENM